MDHHLNQNEAATRDYVTMKVGNQLFGLPVLSIQDVLGCREVTKVPLASSDIAGALNLRGRIVTVIDMRVRLDLESNIEHNERMNIVIEKNDELYSLLVDTVGDVLSLEVEKFEKNPANINSSWQKYADGVFRLDNELMVALDIDKLFDSNEKRI